MFNKFSFKAQVTWLSTSLILITVLLLTASYWLKITDYAETQIERQMHFAQNIFQQNLASTEQVLTLSSSVLTADFGFKQVVATGDSKTIESVLMNHRRRIQADLMMLVDTQGKFISISAEHDFNNKLLEASITNLPLKDVHAQLLSIKNKVFQVIVVPVKAPRVLAYAIVGFEFDHETLLELKELIGLDVTLVQNSRVLNSSFSQQKIQSLSLTEQQGQSVNLFFTSVDYFHQSMKFSDSSDVSAILSTSLISIQQDLNRLVSATLLIGLLVIIIAIGLSRMLSRRVSNPLNILMGLTEKIAEGKLKVPKLEQNLPVEFTELYQGFSVMGSAIENREAEITFQAKHDILTGLYNRHAILHLISHSLDQKQHLVLIAFNIKGYKSLNDTIGINNGDAILKEIASRLTKYLAQLSGQHKANSAAARVSSDQFILSISISDNSAIEGLISSLQDTLERPYWINNIKINLHLYYGIANSIQHGVEAERLIRRVTMAATAADAEHSIVRYYQDGEDEAYLYKLNLIEELKLALESEQSPLFLNYQPKVNIKTGQVDKLEALIRWINTKGDFVNPELFVGLAEQAGLIVTLTRWVIAHVIQQVAEWNKMGHKFTVSINLSAQDIQDNLFVDYLLDTVNKYNVLPEQITLELTERDLAENEQLVIDRLTHLKSLGFEISVDDYGIGQSSLAKLKNLPVDELKIDKCFILNLDKSQADQDIVSSTILLGHKLGLRVIAEGVENKESLELLAQFNCDYAQGYYLSRPVKAEDLLNWYAKYDHQKTL